MITYDHCPSCGSGHIQFVLKARDHTVSQEIFEIWECRDCSLRFTQNIPSVEEIGKYYQSENYISHTDTQRGLINNLYHKVRKRTLKQKRNLVAKTIQKDTGSILDIGCGTGAFLKTMRQSGWQITGIEPDETARNRARELNSVAALSPVALDEISSDNFDAITLWHVLEHVHDLHGYLENIKRLVKPEGAIFIAVPNYTSYDARYYQSEWAAWDVPRHLYHFSPESMKKLAARHGMQIKKIKPLWFDSFYVSLLSQKYKNGKSGLISGAYRGLLSNLKSGAEREHCSSLIYIL